MQKLVTLLFLVFAIASTNGQHKKTSMPLPVSNDSALFAHVKYRLVGPFRGGRSGAVTGDLKQKNTFYFGSTGGGVWKTKDGGSNWTNISDK